MAEEKKMVSSVMGRLPNKGRDFDPAKDIHTVSGKPRLHKVPKAVIQAADQRLFKKVVSGVEVITPEDLRFVSDKVLNSVHENFRVAKGSDSYPIEEATYLNHYSVTHGNNPFSYLNLDERRRLEEQFGGGDKSILLDRGPSMYDKIKDLQSIDGMNIGGRVKKKKKKVVNKYAIGGKKYTNLPRRVRISRGR
jgi:hypothetical protein